MPRITVGAVEEPSVYSSPSRKGRDDGGGEETRGGVNPAATAPCSMSCSSSITKSSRSAPIAPTVDAATYRTFIPTINPLIQVDKLHLIGLLQPNQL